MSADLLTVKLEKLTFGGDALGRAVDGNQGTEGRAVFVPYGLPGETVRVRVTDEKRGHLRAELMEVLEPATERIQPKCRHFGVCGGCSYQHIPYETQLKVKAEILGDQLMRIGKIHNPPVEAMVASPEQWNYRNHVQFHLSPAGKLGFIGSDDRSMVTISECHLPEQGLNAIWPELDFDPDLGLKRVSLRKGMEGENMLVLESDDPEAPELELEANLSVVHLTGEDAVVMAGEDAIHSAVKERIFRVSAGAFFQVNTSMAARLVDHLLEQLPVSAAGTLLDVYCGVGLFSAFFAERVGRLIGVEISAAACEDFAVNLDEFENVELYQAAAENALPALDVHAEAMIVDPPRAGLDKRSLDAIVAQSPDRIAYVSCDPATLARDIARFLSAGYRLVKVTPFDLFPQTYSIESISILEKG